MFPPHSPEHPKKIKVVFSKYFEKEISVAELLELLPKQFNLSDVKISGIGYDSELEVIVREPNKLYDKEMGDYLVKMKEHKRYYNEEWLPAYKKWFKEVNGRDI